jgi:hypothetical protein
MLSGNAQNPYFAVPMQATRSVFLTFTRSGAMIRLKNNKILTQRYTLLSGCKGFVVAKKQHHNISIQKTPPHIKRGNHMKLRNVILLLGSHGIVAAAGFAAGIYALPILIAPDAPTETEVSNVAESANYQAEFRRDLQGSDRLHWGEGSVSIGEKSISHMGKLAPGPDYKLYLSPEFVETEADFNRLKPEMALVGDVKTFNNFLVSVPPDINPSEYTSVIVWCESFGEFITSAQYK